MPGILEVNAVEYYSNETEDDVEKGIVGGLLTEPINPNNQHIENTIIGETFIKPKVVYEFSYRGNTKGSWTVDKNIPVEIVAEDGKNVKIRWLDTYSGQFDLYFGKNKKHIIVGSLF